MRQVSGSSVQKSTESTPTGDPDSVYRSDEETGISSDEEFAPQYILMSGWCHLALTKERGWL